MRAGFSLLAGLARFLVLALLAAAAPARAESAPGVAGDYLAAMHLLYQQDFPGAAARLHQILRTPALSEDRSLRAAAFNANLRAGRFTDALGVARTGPSIAPLAQFMVALDALRNGDARGAEDRLQGLSSELMQKGLFPLALSWAAALRADREGALAALAPLAEISPALAAYTEGLVLEKLGDAQAAETAYRAVDPEIIRLPEPVFRALARLQLRREGPEATIVMLDAYLAEKPGLLEIRHDLETLRSEGVLPAWAAEPATAIAEALYQVAAGFSGEMWSTALDLTQLALWLDPGKDRARLLAAGLLENLGRHREARAAYAAIPPASPYGLLAQRGVAATMYDLGEEGEAIAMLEEIAAADPVDTGALRILGNIYQLEENYAQMAAVFARLVDRAPADDADLWLYHYRLGIALERQKMFPEAEPHFLKALELNPDQPDVLNYLGYSWVDMGVNLERGLEMLETAVENNDSGYIVDSLGWAYYKTGAYGKAVETLELAAMKEPREGVIFDHLGDAYWQTGRYREARFMWSRALTLESADLDADAVREKLAQDCPRFCGVVPGDG